MNYIREHMLVCTLHKYMYITKGIRYIIHIRTNQISCILFYHVHCKTIDIEMKNVINKNHVLK